MEGGRVCNNFDMAADFGEFVVKNLCNLGVQLVASLRVFCDKNKLRVVAVRQGRFDGRAGAGTATHMVAEACDVGVIRKIPGKSPCLLIVALMDEPSGKVISTMISLHMQRWKNSCLINWKRAAPMKQKMVMPNTNFFGVPGKMSERAGKFGEF